MAERADSFYEKWAQQEGIPIVRGYAVPDMYKVPLEPWARKGGRGALIILEGSEGWSSAYLCEIAPGASLKPQRHLFEEEVYILQGQGETRVWNKGGPEQTFAWHEHSLFAIPLNAWHQHRNTGDKPAKYVAVTDAPLFFNAFRNPEFIFNADFAFRERYNGEKDYFDGIGRILPDDMWQGGFIPDARELKLPTRGFGPGFGRRRVWLSGNTCGSHLAQIEVGAYKTAHRHAGGAHIIIAQGTGYANMWKEGGEVVRVDFQKGSLYSPPEAWFHHHFNTGTEVVRQIAFTLSLRGLGMAGKIYHTKVEVKQGGDLLKFEDEYPKIRKAFEEELRGKGLKSTMPPVR